MVDEWGEEIDETGVSDGTDADPCVAVGSVDINTMSTQEFMALADWQFTTVLAQIMGELNVVQRRRTELSVFYYEYKALQERERNLTAQKSACQTILRTGREV